MKKILFILTFFICSKSFCQIRTRIGMDSMGHFTYLPILELDTTIDFPSTAAGSSSDIIVRMPGVVLGGHVEVDIPGTSWPSNGGFYWWIRNNDTVTIRYTNPDVLTSYNPAASLMKIKTNK